MHSLPNAKRLPEGSEDEREIVRRHKTAADLVLGVNCALVLAFSNGYLGEDEPDAVKAFRPQVVQAWSDQWRHLPLAADFQEALFAASLFDRMPGVLEPLILETAHGRTAPLLVVSMETGRVYSPYDGGADLFLETSSARDAVRAELATWLSPRADGL
jgi:hypothetical protein